MESTKEMGVLPAFQRTFQAYGLPQSIRSDNGTPLPAQTGFTAYPDCPSGGSDWASISSASNHEWMHLTLKKETTKPAGQNILQQQARFDDFVEEFSKGVKKTIQRIVFRPNERPHEGLHMKVPAEIYHPSTRPYDGLPEVTYPFHDKNILVTSCGRICMHRKKINISTVLAGQRLGIKEVDDGIWLTSFMNYDLGYIDLEQRTLQPIDNPFGTRLSPMS